MPQTLPNNIVVPTSTDMRKNIITHLNTMGTTISDAITEVKGSIGAVEDALPQRYERQEASPPSLPSFGDFIGQAIWVASANKPYFWNGTVWVDITA